MFLSKIVQNADGTETFVPGKLVQTKNGPKFVSGQVIQTGEGEKFLPGVVVDDAEKEGGKVNNKESHSCGELMNDLQEGNIKIYLNECHFLFDSVPAMAVC